MKQKKILKIEIIRTNNNSEKKLMKNIEILEEIKILIFGGKIGGKMGKKTSILKIKFLKTKIKIKDKT